MRLPDAIAPYASLLKWILIAALLGVVFIGGCNHGTEEQLERDAKAMKAADDRANHEAAQSAILAATLLQIDRDTETALIAATEQAKRAMQAEARADTAAKDHAETVERVERDMAAAKRDPSCKAVLETQTCAALH